MAMTWCCLRVVASTSMVSPVLWVPPDPQDPWVIWELAVNREIKVLLAGRVKLETLAHKVPPVPWAEWATRVRVAEPASSVTRDQRPRKRKSTI